MHTLALGAETGIQEQQESEEAEPLELTSAEGSRKSAGEGRDWLLRLFDSEFFTEWTAILYLFKSFQPGNRLNQLGIRDYICNKLYSFQPARIEKHLAQICLLLLFNDSSECQTLENFVLHLCSRSLRSAVKITCLLRSHLEDSPSDERLQELCKRVKDRAAVGQWSNKWKMLAQQTAHVCASAMLTPEADAEPGSISDEGSDAEHPESPSVSLGSDQDSAVEQETDLNFRSSHSGSAMEMSEEEDENVPVFTKIEADASSDDLQENASMEIDYVFTVPSTRVHRRTSSEGSDRSFQANVVPSPVFREDLYQSSLNFTERLCEISMCLAEVVSTDERREKVRTALEEINRDIAATPSYHGVGFPMGPVGEIARVVHIPVDEVVLLNSREKAPFMICVEVLKAIDYRGEMIVECVDSQNRFDDDSDENGRQMDGMDNAGDSSDNSDALIPSPRTIGRSLGYAKMAAADMPRFNQSTVTVNCGIQLGKDGQSPGQLLRLLEQGMPSSLLSCDWKVCGSNDSYDDNQDVIDDEDEEGSFASDDFAEEIGQEMSERTISTMRTSSGIEFEDMDATDYNTDEGYKTPEEEDLEDNDGTEYTTSTFSTSASSRTKPLFRMRRRDRRKSKGEYTTPSKREERDGRKAVEASGGTRFSQYEPDEQWIDRRERIRKRSVYGCLDSWDVHSMIVKAGDDCRQELMAVQLIRAFHEILIEESVGSWLRPYEVFPVSSRAAFIETIVDAVSVHSLKIRNIANGVGDSLKQHFEHKFGQSGSPRYREAQRNFTESMAAYSVVTYLLQIKDRHNGNILLDNAGHLIHIDFGFMLTNSPGGVNFENAPFKLTHELLEVMDSDGSGKPSEMYDYFKLLCIRTFLAFRKHHDRIIDLVEMMADSGCPCFVAGQKRTTQLLRQRFQINVTEQACVRNVLELIRKSQNAWRSRQYDYYQRLFNGIL